jgi:glutamyl-tRNA reductase
MTERSENLVVAGVNFRKSTLDIRNKFALTTEHIKEIYDRAANDSSRDFFILSTCNRTEIYGISQSAENLINIMAPGHDAKEVKQYAYVKKGEEALKHLFRVASGLDSQILGDYEIIGQLKNAFNLAKSYNNTSGLMEKMVNGSLQASRQVKSKTSLSDGTTSVSYAAIQIMKQLDVNNRSLHICLMGLGKMGTLTLKNLKHYLPMHRVTLVNRNESKAEIAAEEFTVSYAPFANQQEVLKNTDVLIVATGADHPIILKEDVEHGRVKLIFDLSVPSNVSPAVREIDKVRLYDIDELSQIVNQAIETRKSEVPVAESIINEHFEEFKEWESRRNQYKLQASLQN